MLYEEAKTLREKKKSLIKTIKAMTRDDIKKVKSCTNVKQADVLFQAVLVGVNAQIEYFKCEMEYYDEQEKEEENES